MGRRRGRGGSTLSSIHALARTSLKLAQAGGMSQSSKPVRRKDFPACCLHQLCHAQHGPPPGMQGMQAHQMNAFVNFSPLGWSSGEATLRTWLPWTGTMVFMFCRAARAEAGGWAGLAGSWVEAGRRARD